LIRKREKDVPILLHRTLTTSEEMETLRSWMGKRAGTGALRGSQRAEKGRSRWALKGLSSASDSPQHGKKLRCFATEKAKRGYNNNTGMRGKRKGNLGGDWEERRNSEFSRYLLFCQ